MNYEIGETAGKIWHYLKEHGPTTPSALAKGLKVDTSLVQMAIGWLAREEKLVFTKEPRKLTVALK